MRIPRAQDTGALHSRTIEKRIAAENKASIRRFVPIGVYYPTIEARGDGAENREATSKAHDVVTAVHIDDLAGDSAAGV
jgi:hypothetical protein